jgi:uncharacterized SAM-binding protein YcdF (DUF218 family)
MRELSGRRKSAAKSRAAIRIARLRHAGLDFELRSICAIRLCARKDQKIGLWWATVELPSLVLLGCRLGSRGQLSVTATRRAVRAAEAFRAGLSGHILACGGKAWSGVRETDALCGFLLESGVPESALEREGWSRTTRQNAHFAAKMLLPRGIRRIGLVTCDWHMARALRCFEGAGFEPVAVPAMAPALHGLPALVRVVRERLSFAVDRAVTRGFARV